MERSTCHETQSQVDIKLSPLPQKRALHLYNQPGWAMLGCRRDPGLLQPLVLAQWCVGAGAVPSCSSPSCSSSSPLLILPKTTVLQVFPRTGFLFCQAPACPGAALPRLPVWGEVGGRWPQFMQFLNASQFEAKQSNQVGLCQFAQNLLAL